jgi:hypothetical protein
VPQFEQTTPRGASNYLAKLNERLVAEGSELLTNCQQLKMTVVDGKKRLTMLPGIKTHTSRKTWYRTDSV